MATTREKNGNKGLSNLGNQRSELEKLIRVIFYLQLQNVCFKDY
jgi:hypothetical protein